MEALRDAWIAAEGQAARVSLAADMQARMMTDAPYAPLGVVCGVAAVTDAGTNGRTGMPIFCNLRHV